MNFPFVLRSQYDDVVTDLRARLADREKELRRLYDLIFQRQFGVQIHDTLPMEAQAEATPEPELTPEQQAEKELEAEEMREKARLASIARTSPSRLGPVMEQAMQRRMARRAAAARPQHSVPAAVEVFDRAHKEALKQ